jgi:hypothetical protein
MVHHRSFLPGLSVSLASLAKLLLPIFCSSPVMRDWIYTPCICSKMLGNRLHVHADQAVRNASVIYRVVVCLWYIAYAVSCIMFDKLLSPPDATHHVMLVGCYITVPGRHTRPECTRYPGRTRRYSPPRCMAALTLVHLLWRHRRPGRR